jgi:hypothetical protein
MPYGLATAGDVLTAANVNLLPRGRVAFATTAVDQAGITTEVAVTSLTVTFTALAGRYYRITAHTLHLKDATLGTTRSIIRENSTNVQVALRGASPASTFQTFEHSIVRQPAAGSITYSLRAVSDAGAVTISNTTTNGYILVEDIGGV